MDERLKENLGLSRLGTASYLPPVEREIIHGDPDLRRELVLNDALSQGNRRNWLPPAKVQMIRRAVALAGQQRRVVTHTQYRRRASDRVHLTPWLLLKRTSLAVALLLLVLVGYHNVHQLLEARSASQSLMKEQVYQLSYSIDLPNAEPGVGSRSNRGVDKIYKEMRTIYLEWSRQHPEVLESVSQQTVISFQELLLPVNPERGEAQVQIELALDEEEFNPELLDELAQIFTTVPEVGQCTVCRFEREAEVIFNTGSNTGLTLD